MRGVKGDCFKTVLFCGFTGSILLMLCISLMVHRRNYLDSQSAAGGLAGDYSTFKLAASSNWQIFVFITEREPKAYIKALQDALEKVEESGLKVEWIGSGRISAEMIFYLERSDKQLPDARPSTTFAVSES